MADIRETIASWRIGERVDNFFKKLGVKTLDLYMFKSFLGPFIATFAIVTFILMMHFLWLYIDELVGKGLSFGVIVQFMLWGVCTLIPLALPLATLLASIMTMGSLGENSELLSMKSAGIPLPRIMRPLAYIAVVIVIAAFFASNNLIPVAYSKIYSLREDIGNTKEEIKIPVGIFYDGIDGFIIRVDKRDDNDLMHGILVYDHSKDNGNTDVTIADSGRFSLTPDMQGLLITLYNGTNYHDTYVLDYRDTSIEVQKIRFAYQQIAIPLENYAFKKSSDGKFNNEVMAKKLSQLRKDKDSLSKELDITVENLTVRTIRIDDFSHLEQLDTALNKGFTKSIDYSDLWQWKSFDDKLRAYQEADMRIKEVWNSSGFNDAQVYQVAFPLRRTIIESFRKFTLSLACLIFFFIGAPIGSIVRKGGLGTPAIISILFFVLYWVVDISGKKLANDGAISPFVGAFISTFVLAPIGVFLTWKSTQDSAIFNPETFFKSIGNFFAKIFSKTRRAVIRAQEEEERKAGLHDEEVLRENIARSQQQHINNTDQKEI